MDCIFWFAILAVLTWHDCRRWGYSLRSALAANLIILILLQLLLRFLQKIETGRL